MLRPLKRACPSDWRFAPASSPSARFEPVVYCRRFEPFRARCWAVLPPSTTKAPSFDGAFENMARPEGFEPPTAWFVARYSIQLSYGRAELQAAHYGKSRTVCQGATGFFEPSRARTRDAHYRALSNRLPVSESLTRVSYSWRGIVRLPEVKTLLANPSHLQCHWPSEGAIRQQPGKDTQGV